MGQGVSTVVVTKQNLQIIQNRAQIFLDKEKRLIERCNFTTHLRKINHYAITKVQDKKSLSIQTDVDNATKLVNYLQLTNQNQQVEYYWKIFSQLLIGIYQLHQLNLLARCLDFNKIYVKNETILFNSQGYFHPCSTSPEFILKKMPTYETDLWQVGAIMFQILTGRQIEEGLPKDLDEEKTIELQINIGRQINNIQPSISQDFKELIKQILKVSAFSRPLLVELFQKNQIQQYILPEKKLQIIKFYSFYSVKGLLKQWKYSKLRDQANKLSQKLYFYHIISEFIKYFYQDYLEILMLNFIFHFSLHYPCSFDQQLLINQIIIQKMWKKSKSLKLKVLTNAHKVCKEFSFISEGQISFQQELQKLKQQLDYQHSMLYQLKVQYVLDEEIVDADKTISKLTYQTPKTLTQKLSINILNNSSIRQYRIEEFNSMSLEEMFEQEIRQRI